MKINILSDLHLEFGKLKEDPSGDVLILAGDITTNLKHIDWINNLKFNSIIYVLGNHEFYGGNYEFVIRDTRKKVASHVHFLEKESIIIDGIKFAGTTLWTDCNKGNPITMYEARLYLNDYNCIRKDMYSKRFVPEDSYIQFQESMKFLENEVDNNTVVVTHHAPSLQSIHQNYKASNLNGMFASNLDDFILERQPKYWIHGHVHNSFDYLIGNTRVIANPRGYRNENKEFDPKLSIVVE